MSVATSLIPGLDEIIKHGDPDRRAEAARRIAELYLEAAATLRPDHVDLFDGALTNLVPHTEIASRVDLAERLSIIANAPRGTGRATRARGRDIDCRAAASPIACHR